MTKMTYVEALSIAISEMHNEEAMSRLAELKESLNKRNNKESKKVQERKNENAELKERILAEIAALSAPMTVAGLISATPALNGLSVQRVTPIITQLVKEGKVIRTEEHHKAYFSIA